MKKVLVVLVVMLSVTFVSCEKMEILETPATECASINSYYEDLTQGLTPQEASVYIQAWQDALNAAGCPSIDTL